MKLPDEMHRLLDIEVTPSREALRQIVEVFRDGHRAATNLRDTANSLTPGQLELKLEAIEARMLAQIALICDTYQFQIPDTQRH